MAESSYREYYGFNEFLALASQQLTPDPEVFAAFLATYGFSVAPSYVAVVGLDTIAVEWSTFPSQADLPLLTAAVQEFTGGSTDAPIEVESLGVTTAPDGSLVDVIDVTSPPRDAGTYMASWNSIIALSSTVPDTGVRAVFTVTRTQGADVASRQWEHTWILQQPQHFGGSVTFLLATGGTIRVQLQVAKLGGGAAVAQLAGARVTINKLA